jgi:hypothetical protein
MLERLQAPIGLAKGYPVSGLRVAHSRATAAELASRSLGARQLRTGEWLPLVD